jgi:hypothetical protein
MEEVEKADRVQLCRWHRFLKSPGWSSTKPGTPVEEFEYVRQDEKIILDRIEERLHELGGFTPEISKLIGWKT